jgi:hypothetical protein
MKHETGTATMGRRAFDDYVAHAMVSSETVERFWVHLNADGKPWMVTCGTKELPTREQMIECMLEEERVIIVGTVGVDYERFEYRLSREEAEQKVDLLHGVWPPARMLCSTTDNYDRLAARYSELVAIKTAA